MLTLVLLALMIKDAEEATRKFAALREILPSLIVQMAVKCLVNQVRDELSQIQNLLLPQMLNFAQLGICHPNMEANVLH